MTLEMWIIAAARVAGSLPVLRWAFFGAILAILVDFSDLFMMNLIQLGGVTNYQTFDKWIDQVYMLTFLWVAVRQWDGPGRTVAIWLFGFRLIGFATFEVMSAGGGDVRWILMVFPNVFEFWFVAIAAQRHWWPELRVHQDPDRLVVGHLHSVEADAGVHPARLASARQLHRSRRGRGVVELPDRVVLEARSRVV